MKKARMPLAVIATAGVLLLGGSAVNASAEETASPAPQSEDAKPPAPPTPEWVNPDGTVDESKMPKELPLIGPDGEVVKGKDGKPLMVKTHVKIKQSGPPATPAKELKPGESRTTGKDPDGRSFEEVQIRPSVPPAN